MSLFEPGAPLDGGAPLDAGAPLANGDGTAPMARFAWAGETVDYSDAMLVRGRAYGSYVNTNRALPDVRDGLKPVQRRIIVAMDDLGVRAGAKYAKSAKTVGHVIGTYHPHGDGAVYDAMVRMAQPWQSSLPLIDGQGNWGNLNNEAPAAAQRYTESRLSRATTDCLGDLRPEIVDYEANFDETEQMPSVLPVTFPNLIVNGSMGVGWAMACSIPPHNTAEAISAALLVLDDPDVSIDRLLKAMPGPDLPGGGIIVNPENLRSIYETGRGTVMVQGRIAPLPGQPILRITELPYQVSARSIVEATVACAKEGKITEIYTAELPKNLTDAGGVDVQIKVKRGGSIAKLTDELVQHTKLRDTLAFNLTVLVDGTPQTLSLRQVLRHFVDFRILVVTRRLQHERQVLAQRLHLLLAEAAAADVIDRVVRIIRNAADDDDSKLKLIAELRYAPHGETRKRPIDDLQAQHIIDLALKKLNTLNQIKLDEDIAQRRRRIDEITAILKSDLGVRDLVRHELRETKKRYAQPRRTVLAAGRRPTASRSGPSRNGCAGESASSGRLATTGDRADEGRTERPVVAGRVDQLWVFVASDGIAIAVRRTTRPPASVPFKLPGQVTLIAAVGAVSDQPMLLFSEDGRVFRVPVSDAYAGRTGPRSVVRLEAGAALVAAISEPGAPYYLFVTGRGQIKRVPARTLLGAPAAGTVCCRVPDGDRVVAVVPHGDDDILMAKALGQILCIETGAKLRPVPTAAAGTVVGVKVDAGDRVVAAVAAPPTGAGERATLLCLHESGMALRVGFSEFAAKGRGSIGVQAVAVDRPARNPAGPLALIAPWSTGGVSVFTDRGNLYRLSETDLTVTARAAASVPVLPLLPGEAPQGTVVPDTREHFAFS